MKLEDSDPVAVMVALVKLQVDAPAEKHDITNILCIVI